MAFQQGVKFLKINKVDALNNDKTTILNKLKNIRIKYSDVGIVQYDVFGKTEYPTYFLFQVNYKDAVSSIDRGINDYRLIASSSTLNGDATAVLDGTVRITNYDSVPVSNDRFLDNEGTYTIKESEHFPNVTIIYTASVNYGDSGAGYPLNPTLRFSTGDSSPGLVITSSSPGEVNSNGTITFSGTFTDPFPSNKNYFLEVFATSDNSAKAVSFTNARLFVTQSIGPTGNNPLLVVPSPDTALKFEGTDCDVTYGSVDRYDRSQYYMDVDYSTGITIPTNQIALVSGTATLASVKDYYYTLQAHTNPRYQGSRVSQLYLNTYTGPSTTLLVGSTPYTGDTGYGKTPNVQSQRAYVGWFTDVRGASPEYNNAVNINIRYLIDKLGDTYSPQLTNYFLNELRGVFTDGEILNLNFVDNIAGTNSTPSVIKSQLNGERTIIRSGARAAAVLYSQTGSGANDWTSSISFVAGGGVQPQVVAVDFRFGAVSRSFQQFEQNIDTVLKFPQENWNFSSYYTASTSEYQFGQTPASDINFIIKAKNLTNTVNKARSACQIKILKNGVVIGGKRLELDTKNSKNNVASAVVAETGFQQFQVGDKITAQLYVEPSAETYPITVDSMEFIMDQRSISQIALLNSAPLNSPYLFTASADASIVTASSQFKSYIGYGIQTPITTSGFDSTNIPLTFKVGDQFRFENDEGKVYSIAKVLSSSAETPNGETYIQLDRTITPKTNINYFVLRRFIDDPTNIIVQGVKASGGTGPGSVKSQFTIQELEDNLPTIVSKLSSENAI